MPRRGIPEGITKEQLEVAISLIDSRTSHRFADSTKYDVLFDGKRYPPKAVVGLASELLTGDSYGPEDFSGGLQSSCFKVLQNYGFTVVPKVGNAAINVYRVTGPPENFITAMTIGYWAVNPSHEKLWGRLEPGDILLFHSTTKSQFANSLKSSIVGYARVGSHKFKKKDCWWVQEIDQDLNIWSLVFSFHQVCLIGNLEGEMNLSSGVHEKTADTMRSEVIALSESGIPISDLNRIAKSRSESTPNFPVNGSMSLINDVYRELIFSEKVEEWYLCHGKAEDLDVESEFFSKTELEKLASLSKEELIEIAKSWAPSYLASHERAWRKTRKEDARQKKIVAQIEDYTCQVCDFYCEYLTSRGQSRFVIHVDHIKEKADGGDESLNNLWVLCPNCHAKKTIGVIEIDLETKKVMENGKEISIRDSHLF